jgi:hypothetical protein
MCVNKGRTMNKIKAKLIAWLLRHAGNIIYTSKGNLPLNTLVREVTWQFSIGGIQVIETYRLDGEIVKQGCDTYVLPVGTELYIKQGQLS